MKIIKGYPAGIMAVPEELKPLLAKIIQLDPADLQELDAFIDYLLKGAGKAEGSGPDNGSTAKIYEFMNGGLETTPGPDETPAEPES